VDTNLDYKIDGWLFLLAWWSARGQPGENRFGPPQ